MDRSRARSRRFRATIAIGAVILGLTGPALVAADDPRAQGEHTMPPTFELSFSNPGARSMGFGGAFVALADDATAAFANPAGLVQLLEPEVSVEGRNWSYSTPYVESGRLVGTPTGIGLDTAPLETTRSTEDLSGLSFVSVVYPKNHWSLGFYRHRLASFAYRADLLGLYSGPWPEVNVNLRREAVMRQTTELEITSYALAGAYQVSEILSLGLGLNVHNGRMSVVTESFGHPCGGLGYPPCGPDPTFFFERPMGPEDLMHADTLSLDNTDLRLSAGLLWSFAESWRLGASYRPGPSFKGSGEVRAGPANVFQPDGTLYDTGTGSIDFPDVLALGLSFRTADQRLTVGFEWDRVEYSDMVDGEDGLVLEDGDELRLGAEYVFAERRTVAALRLGVWLDPDHLMRYEGENYVAEGLLQGGDDELHFAIGLGLAFGRMTLDLGLDLSDPVDTLSLSTIYRL